MTAIENVQAPRDYTEEDYMNETKLHIKKVQVYMLYVTDELERRARCHDASKLCDPEKSIFIENTPNYKRVTYGTKAYREHLSRVQKAIDHHYAHNSHHPEHYPDGIRGMNLLDVVEMFVDWFAVSEQNHNDLNKVIKLNKQRFGYSDDLEQILLNTVPLLKKNN